MPRINNQELKAIFKRGFVFPLSMGALVYIIALTLISSFSIMKELSYLSDLKATAAGLSGGASASISTFPVFLMGLVFGAKGFDIMKQTSLGIQDPPSLNPFSYASPILILRYMLYLIGITIFAVIIIVVLFFVLGLIPVLGPMLLVILMIVTFLAYAVLTPVFFMILIEDGHFSDVTSIECYQEYLTRLGWKAWALSAVVFFLLPAIVATFLQMVIIPLFSDSPLVFVGIVTLVFLFAQNYCSYVAFYFMGSVLSVTAGDGLDFTPSKDKVAGDDDLASAKQVYLDGYPDDAIQLLENALHRQDISNQKKIDINRLLVDILAKEGKAADAETVKNKMILKVIKDQPADMVLLADQLSEQILNNELMVPSEYAKRVAKFAYRQRRYALSMKVIAHFIKTNPGHKDTVVMSLLYADNLIDSNKSLEKAYKLVKSLMTKYPDHELAPEMKSSLIRIKSKILESQKQVDKR